MRPTEGKFERLAKTFSENQAHFPVSQAMFLASTEKLAA